VKYKYFLNISVFNMASFFKANAKITGGTIDNVVITDSNIDMNNNKITTLGDPTLEQDAVNLRFLNTVIQKKVVTLSGTTFSVIDNVTRGAYNLAIFPDESTGALNGPAATFSISKSKASKHMGCMRLTSSPGDITSEQLELQWLPNSSLELKKSNTNYDGDYCIVMSGIGIT
jgi:hypothetical protein